MKEYASLEVWDPLAKEPWYIRHWDYVQAAIMTIIIVLALLTFILIFSIGRDVAERRYLASRREVNRVV